MAKHPHSELASSPPLPALQVSLLGTPAVRWAGRPVAIARRQVRALLYRLAASREPVPREQLCFLFWPDVPEITARRKLSGLLQNLCGKETRRTIQMKRLRQALVDLQQEGVIESYHVDEDADRLEARKGAAWHFEKKKPLRS